MQEKKIIGFIFFITNLSLLYITPIMFSFPSDKYPVFYYILRALLVLISLFLLPIVFNLFVKNIQNKFKQALSSVALLFILLFYVLELFFTFYPESNGKNDTYTSKTWFYYYWTQNKQGFRDVDFTAIENPNKQSIIFAGDSYTEGHGIKKMEDRVSDICRNSFPEYVVYNIGKCGYDIHDEVKILNSISIQPKYVFLQICSNDWDYLINRLQADAKRYDVLFANAEISSFSDFTILFNYLSSKTKNLFENIGTLNLDEKLKNETFKNFCLDKNYKLNSNNVFDIYDYCFKNTPLPDDSTQKIVLSTFKEFNASLKVMLDTTLFNNYLNKLSYLNNYFKQKEVILVVLPYPVLNNFSMKITSKYVNNYLCKELYKKNIKYIDLYPSLKNANLKSYTVNSSDNHINSDASKVIADVLVEFIRTEK